MAGKSITMKSLSGESLKTGEGNTLKDMCETLIDRHEDEFTEVLQQKICRKKTPKTSYYEAYLILY